MMWTPGVPPDEMRGRIVVLALVDKGGTAGPDRYDAERWDGAAVRGVRDNRTWYADEIAAWLGPLPEPP